MTNQQQIPTPRTDAATFDIDVIGDARTKRHNYTDGMGDFVNADFARTLERENVKLTDALDMQRDEFQRIKALLEHSDDSRNEEVVGICERAITRIEQTVPVVVQRDNLELKLAQKELNAVRMMAGYNAELNSLQSERDQLRQQVSNLSSKLGTAEGAFIGMRFWPIPEELKNKLEKVREILNPKKEGANK